MSYADKTFSLVIGARDNAGGTISNIAKKNATVIFRIEQASIDVVCVTLISYEVMEKKIPLFKRYVKFLLLECLLVLFKCFSYFSWSEFPILFVSTISLLS